MEGDICLWERGDYQVGFGWGGPAGEGRGLFRPGMRRSWPEGSIPGEGMADGKALGSVAAGQVCLR